MRTPPNDEKPGRIRLKEIKEHIADDQEARVMRGLETRLEAMARRRGCADDAPDLAQSTLIDAIRNLRRGKWRGEGPIQAYVSTILRRKIIKFRTKEQIAESGEQLDSLPAPGPDPQRAAETAERRKILLGAVNRLSTSHRRIVFLHYFEDVGVDEIATMLGIPRGTVLSRLHYARKSVGQLMRQWHRNRRATIAKLESRTPGTSVA